MVKLSGTKRSAAEFKTCSTPDASHHHPSPQHHLPQCRRTALARHHFAEPWEPDERRRRRACGRQRDGLGRRCLESALTVLMLWVGRRPAHARSSRKIAKFDDHRNHLETVRTRRSEPAHVQKPRMGAREVTRSGRWTCTEERGREEGREGERVGWKEERVTGKRTSADRRGEMGGVSCICSLARFGQLQRTGQGT